MNEKELFLRIDTNAMALLEQEIKTKRNLGVANSIGDRFLIRLLEALANNTKTFLFKIEKNRIVIKNYATLVYDDHRPTGSADREADGANPQS